MTFRTNAIPPPPRPDWAYFLDVDGTLVYFAERPEAIRVDAELLALIQRVHRACDGALALVSGRALSDLDARLGNLRIPIAGQHGLELRDAQGRVQQHENANSAARDWLKARLLSLAAKHPGVLLEDKGVALAVHYRQAPSLAAYIHRQAKRWLKESGLPLEPQDGRYVLEFKPATHDKGTAITEFMQRSPFAGRLPAFIGDDVTDEHGFEQVNRLHGFSIKVGKGATRARWRLADVTAVRQWLATIPMKDEHANEYS
jgi:trehalose 6-phosphate phosphatase